MQTTNMLLFKSHPNVNMYDVFEIKNGEISLCTADKRDFCQMGNVILRDINKCAR